ncbi:MAG TPA: methyltransferase domain-containing protein [Allosphingosinicella sp.]|nr:methyltransferase domain-containing protein [Allosphingosinicella sp.]
MFADVSRRQALALVAAAAAFPASAAEPGLDAPFVPTPHRLVERMLDLAGVSESDYLIDLGCGDGRIAVAAARRGARSLGVDLDALRVREAAAAARIAGVESRARFRRQDLFRTPIFDASVVALYLLPELNLALRPRLLTELHPGARIVSHAFNMGDWRADREETHDGRRIFLWVVPGAAGGRWALTEADGTIHLLELDQRFQDVRGTLSGNHGVRNITSAALRGTELDFTVEMPGGPKVYRGRIDGADLIALPDPASGAPPGWRGRRVEE